MPVRSRRAKIGASMDLSQFDALAQKVELAVSIIEDLKRQQEALKTELHNSLEKAGNLEKLLSQRDEELEGLRNELNDKADNINMAGEKIRDMVNRLESALA
jgi:predicted  nucleic acid-binding Zn-ribbon protein